MKTTHYKSLALMAMACSALAISASTADAQTVPVTATVTVQNTLTLTVVDNMDFGIVAAAAEAANQAQLHLNPVTDVLTVTNAGTAKFAVVDSTNAAGANITVEDGADGANLNINISGVVNPIFGGQSFALTNWMTSWNGGAAAARTAGTPWTTDQFSAIFAAGVNTLDIGADLYTTAAAITYSDGVYSGGFNVTFSY